MLDRGQHTAGTPPVKPITMQETMIEDLPKLNMATGFQGPHGVSMDKDGLTTHHSEHLHNFLNRLASISIY